MARHTKMSTAILTLLALTASGLAGCRNQTPETDGQERSLTSPPSVSSSALLPIETIDGQAAWDYVKFQTDLGPRPAGSPASQKLADALTQRLKSYGYQTELQKFIPHTPDGPIEMRNVLASKAGQIPQRFIIGAHYDTKRFSDCRFVGANDGGSGVAVALEIAKILAKAPLRHSVQFVFFDGEEAIQHWGPKDSLYGSRFFVQHALHNQTAASIKAVFILDMVGDKQLQLSEEYFSTPVLREQLRFAAQELNLQQYLPSQRQTAIEDDHLPFIEQSIPAIDVIGFYTSAEGVYPEYWHTPEDTLDKVSPESLSAAGSIVLRTLRRLDEVSSVP
ncbi:MAG: DUF4910 domain-containing protein [bacterium]|nr:DUF4910 domain-containing protein [bacterium]